jgi:hypothetical protein
MPTSPAVPAALSGAVERLTGDLESIFGPRLRALVAHGPRVRAASAASSAAVPLNTLALVDRVDYRDLVACGQKADDWLASGVTVPLLLSRLEFERSLDTFPVEYGEIIAHHVVVAGSDPFAGLSVRDDDLRRACEAWGKSHLIQLREGYIEAGGDAKEVARLIERSASPFAALLAQIARLRGTHDTGPDALARATEGIAGLPQTPVRDVLALEAGARLDGDTAMTLFPAYLDAVERLAQFLDGWTRSR